ncbi:Na/Pi cotransporter [Heyndrickxia shackletonii]|uniref:Na/Pi cotransporter n=1 Tax=Heyndrickxia shackletonii TaxID=157838 RepID=A0A0Q3WX86_9BACI|nr:Na/Pi symporter [Heyndrickxia shackletonii]KQL53501.1 Na/Pi cotransporter [Heyndrickxia shackletonii]MBB2480086.1 Na/Pi cotransporter family protein [Bacillus sp. APMAM]NEY99576.1 Na/Pi cotransporter family protein [Heyndrickxia shackletonii]RTZ56457.1 Na/Pi cotransporter family protein [Bacillus sp. SAJ1]
MLYLILFICLVGVFILGITWLRIGLFNLSGKAMEQWLKKVTNTPFKGMLVGIIMTPILQSSGAVMVITVGLVSARVLAFPQTIGIILGTNIGTTFTLEFLSFNLSVLVIPFFILGIMCLFFRRTKWKSLSYVFIGFAFIFSAMRAFERLAIPFTQLPSTQKLLMLLSDHFLYAFIVGIILTACIQSSTVMTGIAMSFLSAHIFTLETGIAIMLGANIGTCITGLLASVGAGEEARLTAYAHIWLNVGGAFLCLPFLSQLSFICKELSSNPETQLAHASVIFNLFSSILVLPIATKFGQFIVKVHGKKTIWN